LKKGTGYESKGIEKVKITNTKPIKLTLTPFGKYLLCHETTIRLIGVHSKGKAFKLDKPQ
jgi:hypothetical protein